MHVTLICTHRRLHHFEGSRAQKQQANMASQSEAQAACINAVLPRDLLVKIASLLDEEFYRTDSLSLRRFAEVCRHWRTIGREAKRRLRINCNDCDQVLEEHLFKLLSFFPCLEEILFKTDGQFSSLAIFKRLTQCLELSATNVKHLRFNFAPNIRSQRLPLQSLPLYLIRGCDRLESLAIDGAFVPEFGLDSQASGK